MVKEIEGPYEFTLQVVECLDCGFVYDANHKPFEGGCECPVCNELALQAENRQLREALEIGIRWMDEWLKNNLCECEGVHTCGKKERTKELEYMKQALEGGSD